MSTACARMLQALDAHAGTLGPHWSPLPVPLRGHQYQAYLLPGAELTANPLNLLAYGLSGWAMSASGAWWWPAATTCRGPGFILLATRVDAANGNDASGEELQDHACTLLTGAGAALERCVSRFATGRCAMWLR